MNVEIIPHSAYKLARPASCTDHLTIVGLNQRSEQGIIVIFRSIDFQHLF